MASPTEEDKEELLLSCRYGDLEDVQQFVEKFGAQHLVDASDENGNTILHMTCANGHSDLLDYILPLVSPTLLAAQNTNAKSTALHWAALNSQMECMKKLVEFPGGPGLDLIDIKNAAGRSPIAEAENAGWEEGANWLVKVMHLDTDKAGEETADAPIDGQNIEVEIEDADGKVAKMSIGGSDSAAAAESS